MQASGQQLRAMSRRQEPPDSGGNQDQSDTVTADPAYSDDHQHQHEEQHGVKTPHTSPSQRNRQQSIQNEQPAGSADQSPHGCSHLDQQPQPRLHADQIQLQDDPALQNSEQPSSSWTEQRQQLSKQGAPGQTQMQVGHAQQLQLQSDAERLQDNIEHTLDRQKAQSTSSKPQLHQQRQRQTDTLCEHTVITGTGHMRRFVLLTLSHVGRGAFSSL